jgi:hypothetical protein
MLVVRAMVVGVSQRWRCALRTNGQGGVEWLAGGIGRDKDREKQANGAVSVRESREKANKKTYRGGRDPPRGLSDLGQIATSEQLGSGLALPGVMRSEQLGRSLALPGMMPSGRQRMRDVSGAWFQREVLINVGGFSTGGSAVRGVFEGLVLINLGGLSMKGMETDLRNPELRCGRVDSFACASGFMDARLRVRVSENSFACASGLVHLHAAGEEEAGEQFVEGSGGAGEDVVDLVVLAALGELFLVGGELAEVSLAEDFGFGEDVGEAFEAGEFGGAFEGEVELGGVEDMEDDDVVAAVAAVAEAGEEAGGVVEQVADHDDDAALAESLSQFMQDRSGGGFGSGS